MKLMKGLFRVSVWLLGIAVLLVALLNFWIISSTKDLIYYRIDEIPSKKVAIILGTSKKTEEGESNKYFRERIEAAARLYHSGVIRHIIVSGDNNSVYYNEPRDMYNALVKLKVPKSSITLDFAGFRTLDSIVRAKVIFGQNEVIIITQDFHCYRALFIARNYQMDAIAFSADNKDDLPFYLAVREILARSMAVVDLYVLNKTPKFLGEEEEVIID